MDITAENNQEIMKSEQKQSVVSRGTSFFVGSSDIRQSMKYLSPTSADVKPRRVSVSKNSSELMKSSRRMSNAIESNQAARASPSPKKEIIVNQSSQVIAPLQRRAITVQHQLQQNEDVINSFDYGRTQNVSCQQSKQQLIPKHDGSNKLIHLTSSKEDLPQIRRVFLKSRTHKDPQLACSDGIVVPHTLFSILSESQFAHVLKFHKHEPLFVALCDQRTFFNQNMSILHRHHVVSNDTSEPSLKTIDVGNNKKIEAGQIRNTSALIIAHIHSIEDPVQNAKIAKFEGTKNLMVEEDDDTIYVPEWILSKLKVKEGEPLCLIFDSGYSQSIQWALKPYQRQVHAPPIAQRVRLTFQRFVKMLKKQNRNTLGEDRDILEELIDGLSHFKLIRVKEKIQILIGDNIYHFTIDAIQPRSSAQFYINTQPLTVDIKNLQQFVETRPIKLKPEPSVTSVRRSQSLKRRNSNSLKEQKQEELMSHSKLKALDLNEIIQTRGFLDLDLIEQVLEAKKREALIAKRREQLKDITFQKHRTVLMDQSMKITSQPIRKNMKTLDFRRQTQDPKQMQVLDNKILVEENNESLRTENTRSSQKFEREDQVDNSKIVQMVREGRNFVKEVGSVTTDSNLQRYTIDKGEIKIKEPESVQSKKYLQISHSNKTLVGMTSKDLTIENAKNLSKEQLRSNAVQLGEASDLQIGLQAVSSNNERENASPVQNLTVEFRNKRSGTVQYGWAARRKSNNSYLRDYSPAVVNKNKLLSQDEVLILKSKGMQKKKLEQKQLTETISPWDNTYNGKDKDQLVLKGGPGAQVQFSEFGETAALLSESGIQNPPQKQKVEVRKSIDTKCPLEDYLSNGVEEKLYREMAQERETRQRRPRPSSKHQTTGTFFGIVLTGTNIIAPNPLSSYQMKTVYPIKEHKVVRPKTTSIDKRTKFREALMKQNHSLQKEQAQLKQQLDQMALSKKGQVVFPPPPGKLSAMFNKYNVLIDRNRVESYSKKTVLVSQRQFAEFDTHTDEEKLKLLPELGLERLVPPTQHRRLKSANFISIAMKKPINLKQNQTNHDLTQIIHESFRYKPGEKDDTSTLMLPGGLGVSNRGTEDFENSMAHLRPATSQAMSHQQSHILSGQHSVKSNSRRVKIRQQKRGAIKIPQSVIAQSDVKPWGSNTHKSQGPSQRSLENSLPETKSNQDLIRLSGCFLQMRERNKATEQHVRHASPKQHSPHLIHVDEVELNQMEEHLQNCFKMSNISVYEKRESSPKKREDNLMEEQLVENEIVQTMLSDDDLNRDDMEQTKGLTSNDIKQWFKSEDQNSMKEITKVGSKNDVKKERWRLIQVKSIMPTSAIHPIKIELDNDYYKLETAARKRAMKNMQRSNRVVSPIVTESQRQLSATPQTMQFKRERGLKTLCNSKTASSCEPTHRNGEIAVSTVKYQKKHVSHMMSSKTLRDEQNSRLFIKLSDINTTQSMLVKKGLSTNQVHLFMQSNPREGRILVENHQIYHDDTSTLGNEQSAKGMGSPLRGFSSPAQSPKLISDQ